MYFACEHPAKTKLVVSSEKHEDRRQKKEKRKRRERKWYRCNCMAADVVEKDINVGELIL